MLAEVLQNPQFREFVDVPTPLFPHFREIDSFV
jgi:hypothetical protein